MFFNVFVSSIAPATLIISFLCDKSHCFMVLSSPSSFRPVNTNDAPCFEKTTAVSAPIPDEAPLNQITI